MLLAVVLGMCFPAGHILAFLIRYFLMGMLFFAFIGIPLRADMLHRQHATLVGLYVAMPAAIFIALYQIAGPLPAAAAYVVAASPAAAAAPAMTAYLGGRVDFVAAAVILSSAAAALILPLMLPLLIDTRQAMSGAAVLAPVASIVFFPLGVTWALRRWTPTLARLLDRYSQLGFYLFLGNIYIASAKATHFLRQESDSPLETLLLIALVISIVCVAQFQLGYWMGGARRLESSQSLGHKNTMFALWLALTFIGPAAALGPIFYLFFQNLYNATLLYAARRKSRKDR
jgi:BASS family bile acid:Na+ symporter